MFKEPLVGRVWSPVFVPEVAFKRNICVPVISPAADEDSRYPE